MSSAIKFSSVSIADYLDGEATANRKHEYVEGAIFAMAGGSNAHNRVASNAMGGLYSQLRGKRCGAFNSDTKVRIRLSQGTRFYYPDAMIVCDQNPATDSFQDSPVVIIEVVSESTRRVDDYEKREAYLSIESLRAYIRLEQSSIAARVDRRVANGFDQEVYQGLNAVIPLPELDCELTLAEVYEDVTLHVEPTES